VLTPGVEQLGAEPVVASRDAAELFAHSGCLL
jgi:hypothetical protein